MRYLLILAAACSNAPKHEDAPIAPQPVAHEPAKPGPMVVIGDNRVNVEVVATEAKIQRGLMFRQHLPPDDGMLFMMPGEHALERQGWPFWMHNTLISLDLIWIDAGMQIVEIVENAPVKNDNELGGHVPSRYVLEVNAGYVAAHHLAKGQAVKFENVN